MPLRNPAPQPLTDKPTAAIAQTLTRGSTLSAGAFASGEMHLTSIPLYAGDVVTSITFISGSTALVAGTHGWAVLYTPALGLLGQSTDDTAITWTANTVKTFTLAAPVIVPVAGWYYVGLMVTATTMPTILSMNPGSAVNVIPQIRYGHSTAGLTTTAPATAAAISGGVLFYAYAS